MSTVRIRISREHSKSLFKQNQKSSKENNDVVDEKLDSGVWLAFVDPNKNSYILASCSNQEKLDCQVWIEMIYIDKGIHFIRF